MEDQKSTLQQQILKLFGTYTDSRITRDVVQRVKQMLKQQMEQIIQEAVKRSILRDAFSNQLEEKDLLSVVEKLGPKYKSVIGYHLIKREFNKDTSMGAGIDEQEPNDD